jgi:lipoate---protein ligase
MISTYLASAPNRLAPHAAWPLIQLTDAVEEQQWNDRALEQAVAIPHLALWSHRSSAIVLGVAQRPTKRMLRVARSLDIQLLRRGSGGGAVLVGPHLLSASLVVPPHHALSKSGAISAYQWFGRVHLAVLRKFGVRGTVVGDSAALSLVRDPRASALRPHAIWSCFAGTSVGEVVAFAKGKKLVGLAQRRRRTGTLLTSGVLVADPDWLQLTQVFERTCDVASDLQELASSCERELGREVAVNEIAETLAYELSKALAMFE